MNPGIETSRINQWALFPLVGLFIVAGVLHLVYPSFFLRIVPPYIPFPAMMNAVCGIAQVALGLLAIPERSRRQAGIGMVVLLCAVFPANIQMALHPELYPAFPELVLYARLPLQVLLIWWVVRATRAFR